MAERADVLIVGGGVIGTSIAWALANRGVTGIVVVDLDLAGVYASSELNAGGVRAACEEGGCEMTVRGKDVGDWIKIATFIVSVVVASALLYAKLNLLE